MDLGAYAQIENLEKILIRQQIEIPRLRGLRLMKDEEPVTKEQINKMINQEILYIVERLVEQNCLGCWSSWKHDTRNDILIRDKDRNVIAYRWNKIHGKNRKRIKFEIKKAKKNYNIQYDLWNSFAGKNVLYVHARLGGFNWDYYDGNNTIKKHKDFLEKCNDAWDSTYCDIYFEIRE